VTTPLQERPIPDIVTELPGPRARAHIEFDHAWTSPSLPRAYPIVPVRGLGCAVEDIDGNVFLDFAAGIAVNSTGHSHPAIVAAIQAQAAELQHFSASDFYLPIYARAAAELARIAPMEGPSRTFIGNSGAEAVEAALKLARYHTRRQNVIAFLGGFHGRTMGAVSLTASKAKYHAHFGPLLPGVYHVPFGNEGLEEIESRVFKRLMPADEFAAVIVEPIQGEGGYVIPEDDFLPRLRELCDRALRRGVPGRLGRPDQRPQRADEDDRAAALLHHPPRRGLREREHARHVERELSLEVVEGVLEHGRADDRPRVRDERVDPLEALDDGASGLRIRQVDARRALRGLDLPAVAPQPLRRRSADAARGAGHERDARRRHVATARRGGSPADRRARGRARGRGCGRAAPARGPR